MNSQLEEVIGLNTAKVLHGGQEYEYVGKIHIGDVITVNGRISNETEELWICEAFALNELNEIKVIARFEDRKSL